MIASPCSLNVTLTSTGYIGSKKSRKINDHVSGARSGRLSLPVTSGTVVGANFEEVVGVSIEDEAEALKVLSCAARTATILSSAPAYTYDW